MNLFKFRIWLIVLSGGVLLYVFLLFLRIGGHFPTPIFSTALDARMIDLMLAWRSPEWIKIFTGITLLGEVKFVVGLASILTVCLGLWKRFRLIWPLWIVLAGTEACVFLGKLSLLRERPDIAVLTESSASFPSGHAAIALAFYGLLAYLLARRYKKIFLKIIIWILTALVILAVGFSRLYLGVHFISDVAIGYALGLLWLAMGITTVKFILSRKKKTLPNTEKYLA